MTSAINLLKPVLEIDNRVAIGNLKNSEFGVRKSGININPQGVATQDFSTNGVNLTFTVDTLETIVVKNIPFTVTFNCSVTATAGTSGLVIDPATFFSVRSFGLHRILQNFNLIINGQSVSFQPYLVIPALERFTKSSEFQRLNLSNTAVMPDFLQNYSDHWVGGPAVQGAVMNPQLGFGQGAGQGYGEPRGTFQLDNLVNPNVGTGNSGTATFSITLTDSLIHPLLAAGDGNVPGLTNINQIQFQLTFVQDIMKSLFCQCDTAGGAFLAPSVITAYSVNMTSVPQPTFGITQITPGQTVNIPRNAVYTYPQIIIQPITIGDIAPGASVTMTTGNYPQSTLFKRNYFFAMENPNTSTITSTNTFAQLSKCNFNWLGITGIFATATNTQNWQFFHNDAGGNMTQNMYENLTGSVVAADATKVLMVNENNLAPGVSKQLNYQITFTATNLNKIRTINYIAYIILVNDAIAVIGDGTMQLPNILLSRQDVEAVSQTPADQAQVSATSHSWFGGGGRGAPIRFVPYGRGGGLIGGTAFDKNSDVEQQMQQEPIPIKASYIDQEDDEDSATPYRIRESNYTHPNEGGYRSKQKGPMPSKKGLFDEGGMFVSKKNLQQRY